MRLSKCRSNAMHNFVGQRKETKVQTDRENEKKDAVALLTHGEWNIVFRMTGGLQS